MDITSSDSSTQIDHLPNRIRHRSGGFYQNLFENFNLPTIVLEGASEIYEFNAAFAALVSNAHRKEIPSRDIFYYLPVSDRKSFEQLRKQCKKPGQSATIETKLITNGKGKCMNVELKRLPASEKYVATFAERQSTSESHAKLQERTEDLEELFFLVSHSLKSPIASIHGFTKLLLENQDTAAADTSNYLDRIHKNTLRMSKMVHDLLEFSKAGRRETTKVEISLFDLLEGIRAECFLQLKEKQIDFRIAPDLPVVRADYEGLNTVFMNLIGNAIKYMPPKKKPRIEVGWECRNGFYTFWVKDNGVGIHKSYHDRAFCLFERADAPLDIEGNGVGLALVKRIVEKHGGGVRIGSQPRKGTTVFLTLPANS